MDPLRSEADAFRVVLIVGAGALTVIVLTILAGSLVGFLWGLLLIGLGAGRLMAGRRKAAPGRRVAVLVDEVAGDRLITELREAHGDAELLLAMVVAPDSSPAEREKARQRMEVSVQRLEEAGLRARGTVLAAGQEELTGQGTPEGIEADEIVVSLRGR